MTLFDKGGNAATNSGGPDAIKFLHAEHDNLENLFSQWECVCGRDRNDGEKASSPARSATPSACTPALKKKFFIPRRAPRLTMMT